MDRGCKVVLAGGYDDCNSFISYGWGRHRDAAARDGWMRFKAAQAQRTRTVVYGDDKRVKDADTVCSRMTDLVMITDWWGRELDKWNERAVNDRVRYKCLALFIDFSYTYYLPR